MYYDSLEELASSTDIPVAVIRPFDEYLANRQSFDLLSVQTRTGLSEDEVKQVVDEAIDRGLVSKPQTRYLCPKHDSVLEVKRSIGKCIDCEDGYFLESCRAEIVYKRLVPPDRAPVSVETPHTVVIQTPETKRWWKSRQGCIDKSIDVLGTGIIRWIGNKVLWLVLLAVVILVPSQVFHACRPALDAVVNIPAMLQKTLPPDEAEAAGYPAASTIPTVRHQD